MADLRNRSLISADNHVIELPHLWRDYIEPAFRDQAPRLVSEAAHDAWYVDGRMVGHIAIMAAASQRSDDPAKLKHRGRWESIPTSSYEPAEYVKAMEEDGVSAAILGLQRLRHLHGRRPGHLVPPHDWPGKHDLGIGLFPFRIDLAGIAPHPRRSSRRRARGRAAPHDPRDSPRLYRPLASFTQTKP
ncbi:MAG: hypothetical protein FJX65_13790 [Alphaproteobacteria bacterium]|nr:hypothetical protein [Alphaproteobacteria bacterium]